MYSFKIKKEYKMKNIRKSFITEYFDAMDLICLEKDAFYDGLNEAYFQKFNIYIEILEVEIFFRNNALKVVIKDYILDENN